jgi:anti-sigma regulatory factor (Ser/Thr protein kinase)
MTGDAQEDMVVAVSEAAGNSVEHAYVEATASGTVELIFWTEPGAVCVEVIDQGVWRTPQKVPRERGRGILVMRGLMESVHIHYGPRGTRVLLRLAVPDGVLDGVR